jgi:hypothetical protein
MDLAELVQLLRSALKDEDDRPTLVRKFQKMVWDCKEMIHNQAIDEILCDLAYNLEFYEPDDIWRAQDPSFFGRLPS